MLTNATLYLRSGFVIPVGVALIPSLDAINDSIGDCGVLMCVCDTLPCPWIAAITTGARLRSRSERLAGGMLVLASLALFIATPLEGPNDCQALVTAALFTSVAVVNGAMAFSLRVMIRDRGKT